MAAPAQERGWGGVAVVIPTLNEAGAIALVVREVPRELVREIAFAFGRRGRHIDSYVPG